MDVFDVNDLCRYMQFSVIITLVNTQNVSITKTVDSSSIPCAESKYGLRIQILALVVMIHDVWLKATATLEPETTQHNSLDRLQTRK